MKISSYRDIQTLVGAVVCLFLLPSLVFAQSEAVEQGAEAAGELEAEPELDTKRETIGWAEKVTIHPAGVLMQAKFVPGDESSSIHATNIKKFQKNGRDWVRFVLRDISGKNSTIEREVLRSVTIRGKKGSIVRYLVHLGVCIGKEYGEAELRLSNRAHKDFKILLGRNILAGKFLLDPSRSYLSKPNCPDSDIKFVRKEKKSKKKLAGKLKSSVDPAKDKDARATETERGTKKSSGINGK
jgi:hypothetical protein